MPDDVLVHGDTERSAAMRHEVPLAIGDPFLYAEHDGQRYVLTSMLERDRIAAACPDIDVLDVFELGFKELMGQGLPSNELWLEVTSRAISRIGIEQAIVDFDFPLGVAERLRADGVTLTVDDDRLRLRRRAKSDAELDGIRRAQTSAEAGMAAGAALLARAEPVDGKLHLNGAPLLAEDVRTAIRQACAAAGVPVGADLIVSSVWQGTGHDPGTGPLPAALPITIDLWPQDEESACWADMTRTFVVGGEPPEEIRRQERLVTEALRLAYAAVKPGITGRQLHDIACDVFESEGYRTQRTGPGEVPMEGFQFSLGHGVGLKVHEDPWVGMGGHEPLVAGDVLAIEPGLWDRHAGMFRLEDLLLVTDDGYELLTEYPYDLTPRA